MNVRPRIFLAALILLACAFVPIANGAPRDELLRLVPSDMSFCAVLQNFREKFEDERTVASALAQMPALKAKLESPEFKKLVAIQEVVLKELDITPPQLVNDLFGDAVVLAYRKGPVGKPAQEQALILGWARDKALLNKVVERINARQKKTGEVKDWRSINYNGTTYVQRIKSDGSGTGSDFYCIHDHLILFSMQEDLLRSAIDRLAQPTNGGQELYWSNMLRNLNFEKAVLAVMVNPRSFDQALAAQEDTARPAEKSFFKEFQKYWQAIDGLGFYVDAGRSNLEAGLSVQVRAETLPRAAQKLFGELRKPSALWKIIPEDALIATSARMDSAAIAEFFWGFCDEQTRKDVHQSFHGVLRPFLPDGATIDGLFKGLGPDWGFWVGPPPVDGGWTPQAMLAIKIQDSAEGAAVEKGVRNALQFLTTIALLSNKDGLRAEKTIDGNIEIKSLAHDTAFPRGFRPSFAVKDGYLVFAGSPDLIRRFHAPTPYDDADETPIFRVSAVGWTQYLGQHKDDIAKWASGFTGAPAKDLLTQIDELLPNLAALDRFEIVIRGKHNLATLTLRLKTLPR